MNEELFSLDLPSVQPDNPDTKERIKIDNRSMVNFKQTNSSISIICLCLASICLVFVGFVVYKQINAVILNKTMVEEVAK